MMLDYQDLRDNYENNTNSYLFVLGGFVEKYANSDYLDFEHDYNLNKKGVAMGLHRRINQKDKIEYLEDARKAVLQQLETPSNQLLMRFVGKNINMIDSHINPEKGFNRIVTLLQKTKKKSIDDEKVDFFHRQLIGKIKQNTENDEKNADVSVFNLSKNIFDSANEAEKVLFVNEQNLLRLMTHLYFQESYLQWFIEMIDFVINKKDEYKSEEISLFIRPMDKPISNEPIPISNEPTLSKFKINLKKGMKVNLIRIIVAMYDNGFFESETKQKVDLINVMNTLGGVLGVDLSDYDNNLSTGFLSKIETSLKVFDTLKQAIQKRYNKRLEK